MKKATRKNPSTYVEISRKDLEDWLDSIGFQGKWKRDERTAGIYLISIGPTVAIRLASTIGRGEVGRGVGEGSMHLTMLSSLIPEARFGTLNKKVMEGRRFNRTINWRKNWIEGIDIIRNEYNSKPQFYERISAERAAQQGIALPPSRAMAAATVAAPVSVPVPAPSRAPAPRQEAPSPGPSAPHLKDPRRLALLELHARSKSESDRKTMSLCEKLAVQNKNGVEETLGDLALIRDAMAFYGVPFYYPGIAEYEAVMGAATVPNPSRRKSASRRPAKRAATRSRPRRR
jgi:hypothetical protein